MAKSKENSGYNCLKKHGKTLLVIFLCVAVSMLVAFLQTRYLNGYYRTVFTREHRKKEDQETPAVKNEGDKMATFKQELLDESKQYIDMRFNSMVANMTRTERKYFEKVADLKMEVTEVTKGLHRNNAYVNKSFAFLNESLVLLNKSLASLLTKMTDMADNHDTSVADLQANMRHMRETLNATTKSLQNMLYVDENLNRKIISVQSKVGSMEKEFMEDIAFLQKIANKYDYLSGQMDSVLKLKATVASLQTDVQNLKGEITSLTCKVESSSSSACHSKSGMLVLLGSVIFCSIFFIA